MFCFWAKLILHNSQFYSSFWGFKKKKYSATVDWLGICFLRCCCVWRADSTESLTSPLGPLSSNHIFSRSNVWGTCRGQDTVRSAGWDTAVDRIRALSPRTQSTGMKQTHAKFKNISATNKRVTARETAQRGHILGRRDPSFPSQCLLGVVVHSNCILREQNVTRQGVWDLWS